MPKQVDKPISFKRKALIDILPTHAWNITKAAIAIGYSKSYAETRLPIIARKNVEFCRAIEAKRQEIAQNAAWNREILESKYRFLHNNTAQEQPAVARGCLDSLARIQGLFNDKPASETDDTRTFSPEDRAMLQAIAKEFRRRKALASHPNQAQLEPISATFEPDTPDVKMG